MDDDVVTHRRNYLGLLTIIQSYAPTSRDQELCTYMVNNARLEGATYKDLVIMLSRSISDGLRHGNWPWTIRN